MQDRESRQLIYPEPIAVHFPMFPGVNKGRVRGIGDRAGNGFRGQHSALQRIKYPFAGQRFDDPGSVADVHQICAFGSESPVSSVE